MASLSYRLLYLPVRARAENIRMMLHFAQIPFEDVTIPFDAFRKLKRMGKFTFGQLPVLQLVYSDKDGREVNRVSISQSGSITRFLAPQAGLMPKDPVRAALCDSYFEAAQDEASINPVVNIYEGERLQVERQKVLKRLPRFVENVNRVLEKEGDEQKKYLMGEDLCYADFQAYHTLEQCQVVYPPALDDYPLLQSYMDRVRQLPKVREYLTTRPPLHELGRALLPKSDTERGGGGAASGKE